MLGFFSRKEMPSEIRGPVFHQVEYGNMNAEDREALQKAIAQSNGVARVFVHPFFDRFNTSEDIALEHLTKAERVHKGVEKVLTAKNEEGNNPPIFFMEEGSNEKKLKSFLQSRANFSKAFSVIVKTIEGESTPDVLKGARDLILDPNLFSQKSWKIFIDSLKALGVKKAIIGGSFFWTDEDEDNTQGYGPGCVGGAIEEFASNGIEVVISNFNNPDAREEAKNNPWLNKFTKNV